MAAPPTPPDPAAASRDAHAAATVPAAAPPDPSAATVPAPNAAPPDPLTAVVAPARPPLPPPPVDAQVPALAQSRELPPPELYPTAVLPPPPRSTKPLRVTLPEDATGGNADASPTAPQAGADGTQLLPGSPPRSAAPADGVPTTVMPAAAPSAPTKPVRLTKPAGDASGPAAPVRPRLLSPPSASPSPSAASADAAARSMGAAPVATTAVWPWALPLLLCYAFFLAHHFAPAISTPDANGYWAQGTLLAETGHTWFRPASPTQYIGMHWLLADDGRLFSRYPPGLSVLVALVTRLLSAEASVWLNPLFALLTLPGAFLLARLFLRPWPALAVPVLLALNPTYSEHALASDSHLLVTCLLVWGLYLLLAWGRDARWWQALAAGLLLGAIPTVRYPEVLYGLGIATYLAWHTVQQPRRWWQALLAGLGALLPLLPLLWRNQADFGAWWRTAYSFTHEQTGFSLHYFGQHLVPYLQQLPGVGIGLFFPLGLIGVVLLWARPASRAAAALWTLLLLPITLLYISYYWAPQNMGLAVMRFLLPTFVLYLVAGLLVLQELGTHLSRRAGRAVVGLAVAMQLLWGGFTALASARDQHYQNLCLATITTELSRYAAPGDAIVAHTQVLQHLDFIRRWKLVDPATALPSGPARLTDDPAKPQVMQWAKRQTLTQRYAQLPPLALRAAVAGDLHTWVGTQEVYFVGTAPQVAEWAGRLGAPTAYTILARVTLPAEPSAPDLDDFGPPGGGPGGPGGPPGMGPGGMGPGGPPTAAAAPVPGGAPLPGALGAPGLPPGAVRVPPGQLPLPPPPFGGGPPPPLPPGGDPAAALPDHAAGVPDHATVITQAATAAQAATQARTNRPRRPGPGGDYLNGGNEILIAHWNPDWPPLPTR